MTPRKTITLTAADRERFLSKVGAPDPVTGCRRWRGARVKGYGVFKLAGKNVYAHRVAYAEAHGDVPDELDHVRARGCRYRDCCEVAHLEPVTCQENLLRSPATLQAQNAAKTHCPRGHALAGDNLVRAALARGERTCRTCYNAMKRERYRQSREAAAA